jgi:MFS family permease
MNTKEQASSSGFDIGGLKANYVLVICSLLWMVNFMDRQVLSVVLEPMKESLGFTDTQAGLVTTSLFVTMALFAIPVSYWADRWSRRKAIGLMAILWSIATLFTGLSESFFGILITRLVTGAGVAGFSAAAMALISASFNEDVRAKKMGIFNLFQIIGITIGLVAGGFLSANFGGWKMPFIIFAIPGVILGVMAFFMQDYKNTNLKNSAKAKFNLIANIKTLLKIKTLAWFYAGYTMFTAAVFAVLTWVPALIIRRFNVGEDIAGLIMSISGAFMVPGVLLGGIWADKWQKKNPAGRMGFASIMVLVSTITILLSILFVFFLHREDFFDIGPWLIIGMIALSLFSATAAAVNPPVMAVTQTVVPQELRGLVWGLGVSLIMILGGAWSPAATGYLSDWLGGSTQGLSMALIVMSLLGFGGFICFRKSTKHYPVDATKVEERFHQ